MSLRFGGVCALTDVSFGVSDGELFSIIGLNGAGKTSIINCISGRYRPAEGRLFYQGQDITALNRRKVEEIIDFLDLHDPRANAPRLSRGKTGVHFSGSCCGFRDRAPEPGFSIASSRS